MNTGHPDWQRVVAQVADPFIAMIDELVNPSVVLGPFAAGQWDAIAVDALIGAGASTETVIQVSFSTDEAGSQVTKSVFLKGGTGSTLSDVIAVAGPWLYVILNRQSGAAQWEITLHVTPRASYRHEARELIDGFAIVIPVAARAIGAVVFGNTTFVTTGRAVLGFPGNTPGDFSWQLSTNEPLSGSRLIAGGYRPAGTIYGPVEVVVPAYKLSLQIQNGGTVQALGATLMMES